MEANAYTAKLLYHAPFKTNYSTLPCRGWLALHDHAPRATRIKATWGRVPLASTHSFSFPALKYCAHCISRFCRTMCGSTTSLGSCWWTPLCNSSSYGMPLDESLSASRWIASRGSGLRMALSPLGWHAVLSSMAPQLRQARRKFGTPSPHTSSSSMHGLRSGSLLDRGPTSTTWSPFAHSLPAMFGGG
jgi:hypothetical protein